MLVGVLTVRELGGGRRAELLVVLALATGYYLGANGLYQPVSVDLLTAAVVLWLAVRVLRRGDPRSWVALGVAFGVALLTKYTIVAIGAGFAVGLLLTPARRWLRTPWPYVAVAIALVMAAPNLAWQASHDWPTLEFLRHQNESVRADFPLPAYVFGQLFVLGPAIGLCVVGGVRLWRSVTFRPLAIAAVVVFAWYVVLGGKPYYPVSGYAAVLAAGAVAAAESLG